MFMLLFLSLSDLVVQSRRGTRHILIHLTIICFLPPYLFRRPNRSYGYTSTPTGSCDVQSIAKPTSANIVLQFFALGDFPYDEEATTMVSGGNDAKCGTSNSDSNSPSIADTCSHNGVNFPCTSGCTYEGQEYFCWKDTIIPWMNMTNPSRPSSATWVSEAKTAFSIHVGDFLKGNGSGNSGRCNPDSFASRRELFAGMYRA